MKKCRKCGKILENYDPEFPMTYCEECLQEYKKKLKKEPSGLETLERTVCRKCHQFVRLFDKDGKYYLKCKCLEVTLIYPIPLDWMEV